MLPEALMALIESGRAPAILDVRTAAEFRRGHVPGAVHVPFWKVALAPLAALPDPGGPVAVYCGHGPRARIAVAALRARGFSGAMLVAGHMARWRRRGLPEER